ncbi:erg26, C-3 sterol dehydrogenase [Clydaea vesicula]|uniref:Erg26, C-3 sterol dehydrogenase n=1 Tax=Clydaea vesicula TaxID=447962 RepID=A0AAD5TZD2_9FUNG|nr:erg26, C-3 sterol dehydrogenase [Clydaea vesicula]
METKKVVVIGGSGLVGQYIIKQLLNDKSVNYQVTSFDLTANSLSHSVIGDITNIAQLTEALENVEICIHCASPRTGLGKEIYFKVNVEGTRNVVDACKSVGVKKLIFTSSASVVYNGQHLLNANEDLPHCDIHLDAYNETKSIAEKLVLEANDPASGFLTIALRPAGIFGPGDLQASYSVYKAAKEGKYKYMVGENKTLFDMTFVGNVAHAHVLCCKNLNAENSGQAYNITNDEPIYWFDFAKFFYDGLGRKDSLKIQIPFTIAFPMAAISEFFGHLFKFEVLFTTFRMTFLSTNRVYDISKARKYLGYKPVYSLEEGLESTLVWLTELRDKDTEWKV